MGNVHPAALKVPQEMLRAKDSSKRLERVCAVLAWGSNNHGQCGVANKGMILHPREVKQLRGKEVETLVAGHRSSCAVLRSGEVFSWGLNTSGQLGLGTRGDIQQPTAVEAFHGHAHVRSAAMGKSHALFLDHKGGVWGVGDNKHGQLGLGSPPMPTLQGMLPLAEWSVLTSPGQMGMMAMSGAGHRVHRMRQIAAGGSGIDVSEWIAPPVTQLRIKKELQELAEHRANDPIEYNEFLANNATAVSIGILGEQQAHSLLMLQGIQDGQYHLPVRTGRDEHPLFRPPTSFATSPSRDAPLVDLAALEDEHIPEASTSANASKWYDLTDGLIGPPHPSLGAQRVRRLSTFEEEVASYARGLHSQSVVKVAASRQFSAALTGSGEVWTFGMGMHHELGSGDVVRGSPRPVQGRLARLLEAHGGAVDIALGSNFCLALARDGTVIAWGNVPCTDVGGGGANNCIIVGEDAGLPRMTHIAAGASHALISDGEKVWLMGTMVRQEGRQPTNQADLSWKHPHPIAFGGIGAASVRQLVSAGSAAAMVDDNSRLWMWGRLASASSDGAPDIELADGRTVMPCLNKFTQPVVVKEVGDVSNVALGTNHVLAAVS